MGHAQGAICAGHHSPCVARWRESARADYDYAWCIQNSEYGYPGDCSYQTREQCQMSASGRKGYCAQNPAQVAVRPPLQPSLRGRYVRPY
ncbi:DUF3551 domain-containing protein [Bradyrhizobium liaoningense]|nr:DUF3551 domain-containing protein [Bradyrhizobium liaoningense]